MSALRKLERDSIYAFVASCGDLFRDARVLDYGCGRQPYKDLIESFGAEYVGYDRVEFRGNVSGEDIGPEDPWYGTDGSNSDWDVVVCTQVLQYDRYPDGLLSTMFEDLLKATGHLVLTYPTHWPEVEEVDLRRFTKAGMAMLLTDAGFTVERHERRAEFVWEGETFALGYGVVARA